MNIYEIPDRYKEILSLLEESDDESLQDAVDNALLDLKDELQEHAENLGMILHNINAENISAKFEIDRLKKLTEERVRRYNALKNAVRKAMIDTDVKRIDTGTSVFSLRAGSKVVEIVDESKLDADYLKVEVITKPIKADIKKAIEAGLIPDDVAKIVTNEKTLTIK